MSFNIELTETAEEDYNYWKTTNNDEVINRIKQLFSNMIETSFKGIGKPEPLQYELPGF